MKNPVYRIAVDDFIKKVSLEELIHELIAHKFKRVWYIEGGSKRILVNFFVHTSKKILDDGVQVVKRLISEVIFTEVEDYEKIIIYDHIKGILSYTSDENEVTHYTTELTFLVLKGVDTVLEKVSEAIIKKITADKSK